MFRTDTRIVLGRVTKLLIRARRRSRLVDLVRLGGRRRGRVDVFEIAIGCVISPSAAPLADDEDEEAEEVDGGSFRRSFGRAADPSWSTSYVFVDGGGDESTSFE